MTLFDTHAHYDAEQFDADRNTLLSGLQAQGVALVVNPGCDIPSSRKALALARQHPFLYAAAGCHPEECAGFRSEDLDLLRELAGDARCVAIGEIGLDYYWAENPPREKQRQVFAAQLALAAELDKPVIVHDRDAHADTLAIVRDFPAVRGVFHCFSGSAEMALELVKLGWYVGFDGPLTYKNARKTVEAALAVPLERILLETDSPYMAPEPRRGRRNDSSLLHYTCEKLAQIKGLSPEACARATLENGKRLFRMG